MTGSLPTLIVTRRPREVGSGWHDARSWFGGAPQLGSQPWPRGGLKQAPLYFLAQIDLADVGRAVGRLGGPAPLPDGALAFFVGGPEDRVVVHVPRSELGEPTAPPPDALAVLEPEGAVFPATFGPEAPRLFPRWPVDVTALDVEPVADPEAEDGVEREEAAQLAAVKRRFTTRPSFFSAEAAYQALGDAPRPFWWHSAHCYLACLRAAVRHVPVVAGVHRKFLESARAKLARLGPAGATGARSALAARLAPKSPEVTKGEDEVARCEAKVAAFERGVPEFEHFVRDVASWVQGTDSWQPMPPEAVERLASALARGKQDFRDYARSHMPHSLADLETETLLALATADDRAYSTLPAAVRTLINTQYLLPAGGWHQMFGRGVDIQGNTSVENEGNVMLLQLVHDDMIHWRFGDMGAFQYWIPPEELARGNWAAARVTFEMG